LDHFFPEEENDDATENDEQPFFPFFNDDISWEEECSFSGGELSEEESANQMSGHNPSSPVKELPTTAPTSFPAE
jgi:hypothetical protein